MSNPLFKAADTFQMPLRRGPDNRITGEVTGRMRLGHTDLKLHLKVVDSLYDPLTGELAVLVAGPGDLGFYWDTAGPNEFLVVVDRSEMKEGGRNLFKREKCETTNGSWEAVAKFAVREFEWDDTQQKWVGTKL